ncbi:MAG: hypothetical protein ACI8R9_001623 [Paraglaciecola sp.]|jgi:PBP1b-binding outer membrane lipoprotein LpoB
MLKMISLVLVVTFVLGGCASVPMESIEESNKAKQFNPPSNGNSGLYIYRDSFVGQALKKDIWVDEKCIGETSPDMFFYEEVTGDKEHKISTESEFSPNDLIIKAETGKNYFIEQYIKLGVFVGGAGVELVSDEEGKKAVSKLGLAKKGTCSN